MRRRIPAAALVVFSLWTPAEAWSAAGTQDGASSEESCTDNAIDGRIVDQRGRPIETDVVLFEPSGHLIDVFRSGADGRFHIDFPVPARLPRGVYVLTSDASGHDNQLFPGVPCEYPCELTRGRLVRFCDPEIELRLPDGVLLFGRVERGDGKRVSGIVRLFDQAGVLVKESPISGDSRFGFSGFPPGRYFLVAEPMGFFPILYPQVVCVDCDVTEGGAIEIARGDRLEHLDFLAEESMKDPDFVPPPPPEPVY